MEQKAASNFNFEVPTKGHLPDLCFFLAGILNLNFDFVGIHKNTKNIN